MERGGGLCSGGGYPTALRPILVYTREFIVWPGWLAHYFALNTHAQPASLKITRLLMKPPPPLLIKSTRLLIYPSPSKIKVQGF